MDLRPQIYSLARERGWPLRELTRKYGTLLILDETHTICTGPGGYTHAHALKPDLFVIGKPIWETYLKGEEPDPKVAMQKVVAAVQAEMKKG